MAGDRWLVPKWQDTPEALDYLNLLLRRNKRRQFGLLEEPAQGQSGASVIRYKILVWGKAGIGKTSTIAKLCGLKVPPVHYETPGIRVTSTFWPAKLERQNKVVFFRFDFWDVGDKACAKFDHILSACKEKLDTVMFLFSFTDRASFEDLPNQMSQLLAKESNVLKLVVGTRFDQFSRSDVTEAELRAFAQQFEIPILRIRNVDNVRPSASGAASIDGKASLLEIAPLMNTVGDFLLQRDQRTANPRAAASSSSVAVPLANMATALPRAPHQQAPHIDRGTHSSGATTGGRHTIDAPFSDRRQQGSGQLQPPSPGGIASGASSLSNPIGPNRKQSATATGGSAGRARHQGHHLHTDEQQHHQGGVSASSSASANRISPASDAHAGDRLRPAYMAEVKTHSLHHLELQRLPGTSKLPHQRHGDPNIVQTKHRSSAPEKSRKSRGGGSTSPLDFSVGPTATGAGASGGESSANRLTTDV